MSGQKLINSKSQSIHIFPVSTLKSDDVTSKSEGAQTCDICSIPDIYQVVFQDVSRLKSDRLRPIKTDQDRSRRFVKVHLPRYWCPRTPIQLYARFQHSLHLPWAHVTAESWRTVTAITGNAWNVDKDTNPTWDCDHKCILVHVCCIWRSACTCLWHLWKVCVCVQLLAIVSKSTKLQTCTVDISGITAKGHLNLKKKEKVSSFSVWARCLVPCVCVPYVPAWSSPEFPFCRTGKLPTNWAGND